MYAKFWERFFDFILSLLAFIGFSPLLAILTVIGAIAMRGNPFFTQARPGKIYKKTGKEKIFKLIKFRTMSNKKDEDSISMENFFEAFLRMNYHRWSTYCWGQSDWSVHARF